MYTPPNIDDYPASHVYRYLLPHERHVLTIHFHPAMLIGPSGAALTSLLAAGLVSSLKISPDDQIAVWVTFGLVFVYALGRLINWSFSYYVVTNTRMLVIKGIFTRDVEMLPLTSATTLKYRRTFSGQLLGYARFTLEGVGQDPSLRVINYIPYPERIYGEVCSQLFPEEVHPSS